MNTTGSGIGSVEGDSVMVTLRLFRLHTDEFLIVYMRRLRMGDGTKVRCGEEERGRKGETLEAKF